MKVNELIEKLNELVNDGKGDYEVEVEMHELYGIDVDDKNKRIDLEN